MFTERWKFECWRKRSLYYPASNNSYRQDKKFSIKKSVHAVEMRNFSKFFLLIFYKIFSSYWHHFINKLALKCSLKIKIRRIQESSPTVWELIVISTKSNYYQNGKFLKVADFVHHSGKIFENPFEFRPERFLEIDRGRNACAHVPFSAGPRNCIGQKFGMTELQLVLSVFCIFI